jgi:hypothetical protein
MPQLEYRRTPVEKEGVYMMDTMGADLVPREEALRRTIAWERGNPPDGIDSAAFDYAAENAALAELGRRPDGQ